MSEREEQEALAFVGAHIRSVGALELLILMERNPSRVWQTAALVRELRSSSLAVTQALSDLKSAGLIRESESQSYTFEPTSPDIGKLAAEIGKLYAVKPISLIKTVLAAPNEKLRIFSDAFKLKE